MKNVLGIMTRRVSLPGKFLPYRRAALAAGFDDLVVFTPHDVDLERKQVAGYVYQDGRWIKRRTPYPAISHDIGFYSGAETFQKLRKVKRELRFVEGLIGDKWHMHKLMLKHPVLREHLIPTQLYQNLSGLLSMLREHRVIMLKPNLGSGGRGIMRIRQEEGRICVEENGRLPRYYTNARFAQVARQWQSRKKYLIQKWLDIRNHNGSVFDVRVVMQKDFEGKWKLVGMGVREGMRGKITSNIKSGGTPFQVKTYLTNQFGSERAEQIGETIKEIAQLIPAYLESCYRRRLAELGLDFAVDKTGHVWIIEVNSKPGRTVLRQACRMQTLEQRIGSLIQYAYFLSTRNSGSSNRGGSTA